MYERSAIVLEKYFNKIFGFNEKNNLKNLYNSYKNIIEETCKYQEIIEEEEKQIEQFDQIANEIRNIQQEQKKLYKSNIKLEEDRNKLFDDLDEDPALLEKKLEKIGQTILSNNERLEELKNGFTENLNEFNERQKERNKCSKSRRLEESAHIQLIEEVKKELQEIDINKIKELKQFASAETLDDMKKEIAEIMINNGKDEKVKFNEDVVEKSVNARTKIAQKEAESYILVYDKTKRLLNEIENEDVKLDKYQKTLRDVSVKLEFLKAEKEYIVSFLDNERMTAINGLKAHKVMMAEACEKFELDIEQFENLYQLVLREIAGKSTKKAYNELYNKEYLKNIEEKEKNFEEAINNIKLKAGTIINSNYWRIDGIKNIYEVFQNEITTKFGKDLSEYQLEELEEEIEDEPEEPIYENLDDENYESDEDLLSYDFPEDDDESEIDEEEEYFDDDDDEYADDKEDEEDLDEFEDDEDDEDLEEDDEEFFDDDDEDYYEEDSDEDEEDDDFFFDDDEEDEEVKDNKNSKKLENNSQKSKNSKGLFNKFFKDKNK
mgnify:CR=1 FL=1|jgi:hypothetical protein